jgi:hypothetical protein
MTVGSEPARLLARRSLRLVLLVVSTPVPRYSRPVLSETPLFAAAGALGLRDRSRTAR